MYDYKINYSGIKRMLRTDAQLNQATQRGAQTTKAIIQSHTPVDTGELRNSARVEYVGVKQPKRGNPRMTWAVTFYARHAAAVQSKTGFMNVGLGRGPKT